MSTDPTTAEQTHEVIVSAQATTEPTNLVQEKITIGVVFLLMAMMAIAIDVYAWLQGATSTLSQVWLSVNRTFWPATFILAFLEGVLIRHVSVPGPPVGYLPPREFFASGLGWTVVIWVGLYATYLWLWQLPTVD